MSVVALTGGSGYVGSIIAAALPPGMPLVRLSRRPATNEIAWTLGGANKDLVARLVDHGVTDLIHAAWDMRTSASDEAERTCVDGSRDLLDAAIAAGVTRIVFISTISAFPGARSIYGQTKLRVEGDVLAGGGIVLRLGLVHGRVGDGQEGGMVGAIRAAVRRSQLVPMIGAGHGLQYRLDANRLQEAIRRALAGDLDDTLGPILLADATPVTFRDLVKRIAAEEGRTPVLLPVPWRLLYIGLRGAEAIGLQPAVRSDSIRSFIHAARVPDFNEAIRLGL